MKKYRKLLVWSALVGAVLLVLLVAASFVPAVQTAVVNSVLGGRKDFTANVQRVAVDTGSVMVEGFSLEQPGVKFSMPKLDLHAGLLGAAGGQIVVDRLQAIGWTLEVDPSKMPAVSAEVRDGKGVLQSSPQAKPETGQPFQGLFSAVELPKTLMVDGIDLQGDVRMQGDAPFQMKLVVAASGVGPGKSGLIKVRGEAMTPQGPVNLTIEVSPKLGVEGVLEGIATQVVAIANGIRVQAELNASRTVEGGESHSLRVMMAEQPVLEANCSLRKGESTLRFGWHLSLSDAEVAKLLPGQPLPQFQLTGEGSAGMPMDVEAPETGAATEAAGKLVLSLDQLGRLPALAGRDPGKVALNLDFDAAWTGRLLQVRNLLVALTGAAPARMEVLQPFAFDPEAMRLMPSKPDGEVARLRLEGFRPEVLSAFLPEGLLIGGGPVNMALALRPEGEGIAAAMVEDFVWPGLSVTQSGERMLALEEVRWSGVKASAAAGSIKADLGRVAMKADGAEILTVTGRMDQNKQAPLQVVVDVVSQLQGLMAQPALAGMASIQSGQLSLHSESSVAAEITSKSVLDIKGVSSKTGTAVPDVNLQADITRESSGWVKASVPVKVIQPETGRTSDLNLVMTLEPSLAAADPLQMKADLRSEQLHVPDLEAFAALMPSSPALEAKTQSIAPTVAPPAANPAAVEGATPAPWEGVVGKFTAELGKVVHLPGLEVSALSTALTLTPDAAELTNLSLKLLGGTITAGASLKRAPTLWNAGAKFAVAGLPIQPVLVAVSPSTASMVSGTLNLQGSLDGSAKDYVDACLQAPVSLQVDAHDGTVTALSFSSIDKVSGTAGKIAGTAGKALGFLKKFGGSAAASKVPGGERTTETLSKTEAVAGVQQALSHIDYDVVRMNLNYLPGKEVDIREFALSSADMQMNGSGRISLGGASITQSPLIMMLQLDAKGDFARQLNQLGLAGPPSSSGHTPVIERIMLEGTLSKISTTQVERWLRQSVPGLLKK